VTCVPYVKTCVTPSADALSMSMKRDSKVMLSGSCFLSQFVFLHNVGVGVLLRDSSGFAEVESRSKSSSVPAIAGVEVNTVVAIAMLINSKAFTISPPVEREIYRPVVPLCMVREPLIRKLTIKIVTQLFNKTHFCKCVTSVALKFAAL